MYKFELYEQGKFLAPNSYICVLFYVHTVYIY
jgi:hypothetical protein